MPKTLSSLGLTLGLATVLGCGSSGKPGSHIDGLSSVDGDVPETAATGAGGAYGRDASRVGGSGGAGPAGGSTGGGSGTAACGTLGMP